MLPIKWMPRLAACLMAVAVLVLGAVDPASSQTFEVLVDFAVAWPMGYNPWAGVILGADGNYYGTTSDGGVGGAARSTGSPRVVCTRPCTTSTLSPLSTLSSVGAIRSQV